VGRARTVSRFDLIEDALPEAEGERYAAANQQMIDR
jgi:hypothetical protein